MPLFLFYFWRDEGCITVKLDLHFELRVSGIYPRNQAFQSIWNDVLLGKCSRAGAKHAISHWMRHTAPTCSDVLIVGSARGLMIDEVCFPEDENTAKQKAIELARRVMSLPPSPQVKAKATSAREPSSKPGRIEPIGEAS